MKEREFKTNDLALATFLAINGHRHVRMEDGDRFANWVFEKANGLEALVSEYALGDARVDPRAYQETVADVREELFAFLEQNRPHGG